ncbi:phosphatase PAP2 family protein [Pedobacter glucosidilyticus]|uniref:phosphatase PAP2 family protein n=1 Tax=Pedobacter glucosidilyticus TaxID=1122941 RepID=UPI000408576B|nr:phosphatase PAP2 family protein [Pedobacter glucosidilyticus]
MIEQLVQLDHQLFFAINKGLSNPVFDFLMPILRNKYTWIPLYLAIIFFATKWYKMKGLYLVIFLAITVSIADFGSASILKSAFKRVRPCNNIELKEQVISRVPCGSGLSFPSTHATDHFAIALFLITIFRKRWKYTLATGLIWAASIAIAQVYVGVHFPIDITAGALLGSFIGFGIAKLYQKYFALSTQS